MGYIITQSSIEGVFGVENVARWSQLDPDTQGADMAQIARAITVAEADVENRFRPMNRYVIPFSPATDPILVNWCAVIAGVWLFQSRPETGGDPSDSWAAKVDRIEAEIKVYQSGARQLSCTILNAGATAPYAYGARADIPFGGWDRRNLWA